MSKVRLILGAIAAAASLAACSGPTQEEINASLKAATASAVPGSDVDSIEILSPELLKAKWVWQAKIGGKPYACDADDQMRLPACQATS